MKGLKVVPVEYLYQALQYMLIHFQWVIIA
jgi:hypothetical protein